MVPSILSGARVRHLHRRDKLADRLMAAGFVAVVFLSACTDVLGQPQAARSRMRDADDTASRTAEAVYHCHPAAPAATVTGAWA